MAEEALAIIWGAYSKADEDIPAPSTVTEGQELVPVPPVTAAKLALYTAMRNQGITPAALADCMGTSESVSR